MRRAIQTTCLAALMAASLNIGTASACADLQALFNPSADAELVAAVTERRFKAAQRLLDDHASKALPRDTGGALLQSVLSGHAGYQLTPATVRLMKGLLKAGADADAIRPGSYTPLMIVTGAAEDPALVAEMIDALLAAGADINARSNFGTTPLMHAASEGNTAAVEMLLRFGADPALKDEDGQTAADNARLWEHDALAEKLGATAGG